MSVKKDLVGKLHILKKITNAQFYNLHILSIKADSHIACRAAKGLDCVFPIWFT